MNTLFKREWLCTGSSEASIVIVHGLAEHSERYAYFADRLNKYGYDVYSFDLRGHGYSATSVNDVGYYEELDFWRASIQDIDDQLSSIREKESTKPIVLFGHSMGSMLVRAYLSNNSSHIQAAILSATGADPGLLGSIARFILKVESIFKGSMKPTPLMHKLSFGKFNHAFRPNRTEFDWLSRDNSQVDKYNDDPLCGGIFTIGFWKSLLRGVKEINLPSAIKSIRKDLPILFIAGEKDPVGDFGKGVRLVYNEFLSWDKKAELFTYDNARHELLNEINKDEVIKDVIGWIKKEGA